jgi:creatinine amidohydrolase
MFKVSYDGNDGKRKILWQEMWRHEFEEVIKHDPVVIVPTGSVEQHGPHCPVDVDIVDSFYISVEAARKIEDFPAIVSPPVWSGFAHYNMGFAGTISLRMDTYRNLVLDICRSIYANGFKRILLLNGHGGNHAPNKTIQTQLSEENIFLIALSWWELVPQEMRILSTSDGENVGHGGEWETSVQLHLRPHMILREMMVADRDLTNPFSEEVKKFMPGWGAFAERRRDTEKGTGVMGNPLVASAEKGKQIVDAAAMKLANLVREYHQLPVRQYKEFGSFTP